MTPGTMARFLKALYAEAGVTGASSHSGRRTRITRLAELGVDLKAIAEIAGHTCIRTTAMYVESNPNRLARMPASPQTARKVVRPVQLRSPPPAPEGDLAGTGLGSIARSVL